MNPEKIKKKIILTTINFFNLRILKYAEIDPDKTKELFEILYSNIKKFEKI